MPVLGLLIFSSCKDDDVRTNDQEQITTVTLQLTPVGKGTNVSATYRDVDGPGGQAPVVESLVLEAQTTYNATVSFYNEASGTTRNVTPAISGSSHEHEVFYFVTGANVNFTKTDLDRNGRPIGLTTTVEAGAPSAGTVQITLKHQPNLKSNTSTVATGETDIEVVFNTTVQ